VSEPPIIRALTRASHRLSGKSVPALLAQPAPGVVVPKSTGSVAEVRPVPSALQAAAPNRQPTGSLPVWVAVGGTPVGLVGDELLGEALGGDEGVGSVGRRVDGRDAVDRVETDRAVGGGGRAGGDQGTGSKRGGVPGSSRLPAWVENRWVYV
jgi:hypothetical protein